MNNKSLFFKTNTVGLVVCAALLGTLTGCVGYVNGPSGGAYVAPAVAVQDDYVYYPSYGVYYSTSRGQYAYQENGGWVNAPAPRGVSVDVLLASPSVKMNFHDAPANHHAAVVQQYPKNWKPSGSKPGGKENQKNDRPGDHAENNGR
jgi:hypothetical protein